MGWPCGGRQRYRFRTRRMRRSGRFWRICTRDCARQGRVLRRWQQLRSIPGRKTLRFLPEFCLAFLIKLRWRCRARCYGHSDLLKESLQPSRRADAKETNRLDRCVAKLMRCICGDVHGVTGAYIGLLATEDCLDFALEHNECLFKI